MTVAPPASAARTTSTVARPRESCSSVSTCSAWFMCDSPLDGPLLHVPRRIPEEILVAATGDECEFHTRQSTCGQSLHDAVHALTAPIAQLRELGAAVHFDPLIVACVGGTRLHGQGLSDFAKTPHARQQCGNGFGVTAEQRGPQQEIGVA